MQGVQGEQGTQGLQGFDGMQGTQGETGSQGIQGLQGDEGLQGTAGQSDTYKTTSTTSLSIASSGTKTLTVDTGLSYSVGQDIVIAHDVNNHMSATVDSYNSGNGQLVASVNDSVGSGTYASWSVNLDGATGVQGTQGLQGLQGETGTQGLQGTDGTQGTQGTSGLAGTYATTITPTSPYSDTVFAITHSLGTTDVQVVVYDTFSDMYPQEVVADILIVSTNVIDVVFAAAPTSGQTYRVVVRG